MSDFKLSTKSKTNLYGVHPDLIKVVERAIEITDIDFAVLEGLRTVERQEQLCKAGASKTMKSRHLTGHAVDLGVCVNGELRWDWPLYSNLSFIMKRAAKDCDVLLEWGGDWASFKDGPHYQLPLKKYPA